LPREDEEPACFDGFWREAILFLINFLWFRLVDIRKHIF
jgi:hypothetical protein